MKHQVCFLLFLAFCLLMSCCSQQQSNIKEVNNDTIVCKKEVQDYFTKYRTYEYFIINKGDTSAYSFIFRSRLDYLHNCNMEIVNFPRYKQYMMPKDATISCYEPNYKDFLKEMDLCLNAALNEKDTITLNNIIFRLFALKDIAVKTSNEFYKMGRKRKDITHENILESLQKTSIKEDFNTILQRHNLFIVEMACCEEIYLASKKEFLNNSEYVSKEEAPDSILDVDVVLKIAHI